MFGIFTHKIIGKEVSQSLKNDESQRHTSSKLVVSINTRTGKIKGDKAKQSRISKHDSCSNAEEKSICH